MRDTQGEYALKLSDRIMELDLKNAILTVNYSEKLILLIREIRQLTELGYRKEIPQEVMEACEQGRKYFKEALSLKKIANFYNNMSDEIMDSQKGMIVEELVYFEECVKSVKLSVKTKNKNDYISWDNPDYLDSYIQNLNTATNNLLKENSRIRNLHIRVIDCIC
jgi:dynein heavy chain 2